MSTMEKVMDNPAAGPSNHHSKEVKKESILEDDGQTSCPRSASVSTCDLSSILDHLKVEEPPEAGVIKNLVGFLKPSSVDEGPKIKQEIHENDLADVKQELVPDEEVELKDLNLENCHELKTWLKVENDDSFESKEILGASSDLKFRHEASEYTREPSAKNKENTYDEGFPSTSLLESFLGNDESKSQAPKNACEQGFEKRRRPTAESLNRDEENANWDGLPSTSLLKSLLDSETSKSFDHQNLRKQDLKKRGIAGKEDSASGGSLASTSSLKSQHVNTALRKNAANKYMLFRDGAGEKCKVKRNLCTFPPGCLGPVQPQRAFTKDSEKSKASSSLKRKHYQCDMCSEIFPNYESLLKHTRINCNPLKNITHRCKICGESFLTESHLKQHVTLHTEEESLCPTTEVEQITLTNLNDDDVSDRDDSDNVDDGTATIKDESNSDSEKHNRIDTETNSTMIQTQIVSNSSIIHTDDIFCQCVDCEKDFKSSTDLCGNKQTSRVRKTTKYRPECEICKKSFYRDTALYRHMKNVHGNKKKLCKICCRAYSLDYFEIHMKNQHSSLPKKRYKCSECDKCYVCQEGLKRHILSKHNNVLKLVKPSSSCDDCGKTFSSRKYLLKHRLAKHSEAKDKLTCAHCNAQFIDRATIKSHMITVHLPPTIKCAKCDLLFCTTTKLNKHLLIQHSIGKLQSYICEACGKTFDQKIRYDYHMKTSHSDGKKTFKCKHCEKSFSHKHLLRQHSVVHSEARMFNCGMCDKAFKLKHHLRQHMAVHGLDSTPDYRKKPKQ